MLVLNADAHQELMIDGVRIRALRRGGRTVYQIKSHGGARVNALVVRRQDADEKQSTNRSGTDSRDQHLASANGRSLG